MIGVLELAECQERQVEKLLTAATSDRAEVDCIAIIHVELNQDAPIVLSVWIVAAIFSTNHTVALAGVGRI